MGCCHFYAPADGGDHAFSVDPTSISYGRSVITELGFEARHAGIRHCALITDPRVRALAPFERALKSLKDAGVTWEVYDEISVEPTRGSFQKASEFAADLKPDGFISIGGGSVIDTTKAANLYSTHPAPLMTYVNAPVGDAQPVPGPLKPHIACPTTSGTGSECTGIAIFDDVELGAKTGIASRQLRPTRALIDPDWTDTLPKAVVACSAFDVLSHALESYTARPYTQRPATPGVERPLSQGANPWSDMGCAEALRILGRFMVRAVNDPQDAEARAQVMWAATLAGIAFGNCGVHLPHGMSYSVATCAGDFMPAGYPLDHPVVPHGMSVIISAPAVFTLTAAASPERHLSAARWLGANIADAGEDDAGIVLAEHLRLLMGQSDMPIGLVNLGYQESDIERLTSGAIVQERLLSNAPVAVDRELLGGLFTAAMTA
ncbi:MAG: hydroxyacid-oxoacid transhydrogenase [Pseudomonadota bacterium]